MTWPVAFVLTLLIEVPLALVVLGPRARVAAVAALATAITHPLLCFVLLEELPGTLAWRAVGGEAVVIAIEAVVLAAGLRLRAGRAIAASALLNGTSYVIGLALA